MIDETTQVFAYGILMRDGSCAATLSGYRLDFGGHATVVEEEGGITYGCLIRDVTPWRLDGYDAIEGVRSGYYERRWVMVQTARGDEGAWVYVMNARDLALGKAEGWPVSGLVERMRHEYDMLGHPIRAYAELERRHEEARP